MKHNQVALRIITILFLMLTLVLPALPTEASTLTISRTSATIATGESITLTVKSGSKTITGAAWGSSNANVATVVKGVVTGKAKGSAIITAMYGGTSVECLVSVVRPTASGTTRYNILIMDCSGSMKGTPIARAKTAAKRFAKAVLKADGKNYVALIALNSTSKIVYGFTSSQTDINNAINSLKASGGTNMRAAFNNANELMKKTAGGSNVLKNVILCSDGLPERGTKQTSGRYKKSDHKYYAYANAVYKLDTTMKSAGQFIYALGFFHSSKGNDLVFGKRLMKDLASVDKYHEIDDPDDMDDVFDDIIETITKVTISDTSKTMYVGDQAQLTAYKNGAKTTASWKSSNTSVATVSSSGKVTAKKKGTCVITATVGGKQVTCKITVKERISVKLNKTSVTIQVGETFTLKAAVTGTASSVTWKSSATSIATVSSIGKIKGIKVGKCRVTASVGGASAVCNVTVVDKPYPDSSKKFGKHHYKRYDLPMTWQKAKEYCEKLGGHLVTITSAEEQTFMADYVLPGKKNYYWIGAKRDANNRFTKWITGEPINYTHYDTQNGEPNNYRGVENVLVIYRIPNPKGGSSGALKWNDLSETGNCNGEAFFGEVNSGFICEWDE